MSVNAYVQVQNRTENARATEYRLFAQVTRAMMEARDTQKRDKTFVQAIDWNRKLWLTLTQDLSHPDNKLPDQLKAQLISIGIWVTKHSGACLRGEAQLDPMIDVNRSVMAGLAERPAAA